VSKRFLVFYQESFFFERIDLMNSSGETQSFKILLWIEQQNHFLVATQKNGERHLPEIEPAFAETTLESIERFGMEYLNENIDVVDLVDVIEQTTHQNFNQTETLFIYKATLKNSLVIPKLTHSQIFFWLPIEKASQTISQRLLDRLISDN